MPGKPAVGRLDGRNALRFAGCPEQGHGVEIALLPIPALIVGAMGEAAVRGSVLKVGVAAGEKAARQGVVGAKAQAEVVERRLQLRFRLSGQRVVDPLVDRRQHPAVGSADVPGVRHHPCGEVAQAQLLELALPVQLGAGFEDGSDRRVGVGKMQIEYVHAVGPEPLQRGVQLIAGRRAVQPAGNARIDLGGDPDLIPADGAQRFSQKLFAAPLVVDIGRVQLVIAGLEEDADERLHVRREHRFAEGHRTQNEFYVFHSCLLTDV